MNIARVALVLTGGSMLRILFSVFPLASLIACYSLPYYPDRDGDGFGDMNGEPVFSGAQPDGYVANNDDCNDNDATIRPEAYAWCERTKKTDMNCDGDEVDGELPDLDGDKWGQCDDCDESDPAINPDAVELCDGKDDENCDGKVDEGYDIVDWGRDGDDDYAHVCEDEEWWGQDKQDCDDEDPTVYPNADELCDGIDNDCNGEIDDNPNCP